jgi:hypothetical protein
MAKVEQANPAIKKVGRGIYTYDPAAEVPIFMKEPLIGFFFL